jgi:hypothetical protein
VGLWETGVDFPNFHMGLHLGKKEEKERGKTGKQDDL